jgi:glucokinase
MYTLAVDIGGTKIASGIMNENQEWASNHIQESNAATAESMYDSLVFCMNEVLKKAGLKKGDIGTYSIALPGQVDLENGIAVYQNNLPWRNFKLGELLKSDFSTQNILFEHDVMASALGEYAIRHESYRVFTYITISTGIAASILCDGKPMRGSGIAGEIGFFPIGSGTLETVASGSAMERELNENFNGLTLIQALDNWKNENQQLKSFFDEKAHHIALGIFHLTAVLDPHKIVLGGGVINNQPEFFELIKKHYFSLCSHPLQYDWPLKLEASLLKGKSGLYGAAAKAIRTNNRENKKISEKMP